MRIRKIIGIVLGLGVFFYALNMNYGLWRNGDEIWWFGWIMQFVFSGLSYGVYRACTMKTFQEEYKEQFPDNQMEKREV